ncbi:MAG: hypothetical protein QW101_07690 [Ignisphaera sp.]|uniref:Uncharacterized protein n=1 Tax=Ignisphaera aggregans TaxID=334771 RepID=A0A7J3N063_9CREN
MSLDKETYSENNASTRKYTPNLDVQTQRSRESRVSYNHSLWRLVLGIALLTIAIAIAPLIPYIASLKKSRIRPYHSWQ